MVSIVVAYGKNRELGTHGDLPWGRSLPADLAHFRILTRGKSVIMGRKTFESLGSKPLTDRQNIVVTANPPSTPQVAFARSLDEAFALAQREPIVIGGERIFSEALERTDVDQIYATEVNGSFDDADVYFPTLDARWREVAREHHTKDERNSYDFDFVTYVRS